MFLGHQLTGPHAVYFMTSVTYCFIKTNSIVHVNVYAVAERVALSY